MGNELSRTHEDDHQFKKSRFKKQVKRDGQDKRKRIIIIISLNFLLLTFALSLLSSFLVNCRLLIPTQCLMLYYMSHYDSWAFSVFSTNGLQIPTFPFHAIQHKFSIKNRNLHFELNRNSTAQHFICNFAIGGRWMRKLMLWWWAAYCIPIWLFAKMLIK